MPGIGIIFIGGTTACSVGAAVDVREADSLHGIEVIEVAPEFLEAVGGRQGVRMIAEVVLAELAGVVAKVEHEFRQGRCAGAQVGDGAGQLRHEHAGSHRMHAGEERGAPRRAALLGVVVHHDAALSREPVDVRGFSDHQAAVIAARLHPADVVAHDEQDVRFLVRRVGGIDHA